MRNWTLREIDQALVNAGWPPTSPWWWSVLDEVYSSGVRNVPIEGGRRGGKSSTLAGRVGPFELVSGRHIVPPGDIGYWAVLSADKDQAQERLDTAHKALDVLDIPHRTTANEITLKETNLGIKVFAATRKAVVSFTCIGFMADEMALWTDDNGANPASMLLGLLRPTMATMPNAIGWYPSAPFTDRTLHAQMVDNGNTPGQRAFKGTSVEMNPTLTDEMIEALEEDEPTRRRAYYCERMPSDERAFFPSDAVDRAAVRVEMKGPIERTASGGDFAFRRNSSALVVLRRFEQKSRGRSIKLIACEERIPKGQALKPSKTIKELAAVAISQGADSIATDLHYIETVREVTEDLNIELIEYPTDENEKHYVNTRVCLADDRLDLSDAPPKLLEQLKDTTSQPTAGGTVSIKNKTVGNAHGDLVSALVCAIWALDQELPADKLAVGDRRFSRAEYHPPGELTDLPTEEDLS